MDNPGEAETFLNKATSCVNAVTAATSKRAGSSIHSANDSSTTTSTTSALTTPLQMRYRLTAARVLDGARRYLEAAGRYFELIALVLSLDESEVGDRRCPNMSSYQMRFLLRAYNYVIYKHVCINIYTIPRRWRPRMWPRCSLNASLVRCWRAPVRPETDS